MPFFAAIDNTQIAFINIHEREWLTYSWSVLVHKEQEVMELDTIREGAQDIVGMTKSIPIIIVRLESVVGGLAHTFCARTSS